MYNLNSTIPLQFCHKLQEQAELTTTEFKRCCLCTFIPWLNFTKTLNYLYEDSFIMCPCFRIHPPENTGLQQELPVCSQLMKRQPVMRSIQRIGHYEEMYREVKHPWELWLQVINFYLQPPVCMHILILPDCSQKKMPTPVTDSVTNGTRCPCEN